MDVESSVHLLELPKQFLSLFELLHSVHCAGISPCLQIPGTHLIPEEIPLPSTQIIQAYTSIKECAYNLSGWKNKVWAVGAGGGEGGAGGGHLAIPHILYPGAMIHIYCL